MMVLPTIIIADGGTGEYADNLRALVASHLSNGEVIVALNSGPPVPFQADDKLRVVYIAEHMEPAELRRRVEAAIH